MYGAVPKLKIYVKRAAVSIKVVSLPIGINEAIEQKLNRKDTQDSAFINYYYISESSKTHFLK